MTNTDPFALARSGDDFTLEQAARLVCDVPLSRVYPHKPDAWTQDLRDEYGRVMEALRVLQADAVSLGVAVTEHPAEWACSKTFATGESHQVLKAKARLGFGNVSKAALKGWCDDRGLRPAFLIAPALRGNTVQTGELNTRERETLLQLIGVLCEAAGFDLRHATKGHSEAAKVIVWATERNVRTGKETIAAKISAARELIAPKGPVQHAADTGSHSNSNRSKSSSNKPK